MISATVKQFKQELSLLNQKELVELCLILSKFKKENKELLTYLLYEASNEDTFIQGVKKEMDEQFEQINKSSIYLMKKSVRKILRTTKKFIRYSRKTETDVALRMHFCVHLKALQPNLLSNLSMIKLYDREVASIKTAIESMHDDLQYDYLKEFEVIKANL